MFRQLLDKQRLSRLIRLIENNDLDAWRGLAAKLQAEHLLTPVDADRHALSLCIDLGHADLLAHLLHLAPEQLSNSRAPNGRPLSFIAIEHEQHNLALLSVLLAAGADVHQLDAELSLLDAALQQPAAQRMLLLNRLNQHGASFADRPILERYLSQEGAPDPALIKFLIDSGARVSGQLLSDTADAGLRQFMQRCVDDKRLRELWR